MHGSSWCVIAAGAAAICFVPVAAQGTREARSTAATDRAACEALLDVNNLTITSAVLKPASGDAPEHCYVRGTIAGRIRYNVQLPLRSAWNGRLVNIGDGGKDGALNVDNSELAAGFAVANSNTGHDNGSEP